MTLVNKDYESVGEAAICRDDAPCPNAILLSDTQLPLRVAAGSAPPRLASGSARETCWGSAGGGGGRDSFCHETNCRVASCASLARPACPAVLATAQALLWPGAALDDLEVVRV